VRVALLLATMKTPWRFRTKRNLWAYSGLAVVTKTTAEYNRSHRTNRASTGRRAARAPRWSNVQR
jgi:hypothetical protein